MESKLLTGEIMNNLKMVMVMWTDAYGCSSEWVEMSKEKPEKYLIKSIGLLLHDGEDHKVIVPHYCSNSDTCCGDMTIPTVCIESIVELVER